MGDRGGPFAAEGYGPSRRRARRLGVLLGVAVWSCAALVLGQALDADRDGLEDSWELEHFGDLGQGTDGDPDGDGLYNQQEESFGSNPARFDSDGDVLSDRRERDLGTNPLRADSDRDGLTDYGEVELHDSDPQRRDSDGGGRGDGEEVLLDRTDPLDSADDLQDSDGDGLSNSLELRLGTNPLSPDSDGDLLGDDEENPDLDDVYAGDQNENGVYEPELGDETDPVRADSDGDGLDDGLELFFESDPFDVDSDDDGYLDGDEYARRLDSDVCLDPARADSDFDGVDDGVELDAGLDPCAADSDLDGTPDVVELDQGSDPALADAAPDADLDGLSDAYETDVSGTDPSLADTDGDGLDDVEERYPLADRTVTDARDADSDDDGLLDGSEGTFGAATNPLDPDTDGDGLSDGQELGLAAPEISVLDPDGTELTSFVPDADPGSTTDPLRRDSDVDTLEDGDEDRDRDGRRQADETDPNLFDTDADGMSDPWEARYSPGGSCPAGTTVFADATGFDAGLDGDGDGLNNITEYLLEVRLGLDLVPSPTSPCDADSDDDGLNDGAEASSLYPAGQTDPNRADTDRDGLADGLEDSDSDGHRQDLLETDPTATDSDGDGLRDDVEDQNRNGVADPGETDPRRSDTDEDGLGDGAEVLQYGTLPLGPDTDRDGLLDGVELGRSNDAAPNTVTDPRQVDSDGDGLTDGAEDENANGRVDPGETDPIDYDSDDGGVSDGVEVNEQRSDPLNPADDDGEPDVSGPDPGSDPSTRADAGPDLPGFEPPPDLPDAGLSAPVNPRFQLEPNAEIRGSGACGLVSSASSRSVRWLSGVGVALLTLLAWARRGRRVAAIGTLACLPALLSVATARAQTGSELASARNTDIDVNPHRLDPGGFDLLGTSRPRVLPHLGVRGAALLHHLARPAVVADRSSGDTLRSLVGNREEVTLGAAVGLYDRLQVSVTLPAVLHQRAELPGQRLDSASSSGFGNLTIVPRALLYRARAGSLRMGLEAPVTLPLWETPAYMGYEGWGVAPRLLSEQLAGPIVISVALGALIKRDQRLFNLVDGDQLTYGVAAQYPEALPGWDFGVEFQGATPLEHPGRSITTRGEVLAGARHHIGERLSVTGGAGAGLLSGIGQASYRIFVAVGYAWMSDPADAAQADDAPPDEPQAEALAETPSQTPVARPTDAEPASAADCRDPPPGVPVPPECRKGDDDGDRVIGAADRCPAQAEDMDGFQDQDGCPDADNDGDGALDEEDGCPLEPEDRDAFKDADGCPEPDNDGDGVLDGADACPLEAENFDATDDADGCPEAKAAAPAAKLDVPSTNARRCPDGARPTPAGECLASINLGLIELTETILFGRRAEKLMDASLPMLDQVVDILDAHPELRVMIVGHSDGRGDYAANLQLSQMRATMVREYLLGQSKNRRQLARRLQAIGLGSTEPIADNDSAVGRARNRRVEFRILTTQPVDPPRPAPAARPSPSDATAP